MNFEKLCEYFEELSNTSKRLEKTEIISRILLGTPSDLIDNVLVLIQGRVFPIWDQRKLGISSRQIITIIKTLSSKSVAEIELEWKKTGDLGLVAQNLLKAKNQQTLFATNYSLKEIFNTITKLADTTGTNSTKVKQAMIAKLYSNATQLEAKYLTRILLENMQIGVGPGTIREAIIWAYLPKVYSVNFNLDKSFLKENKKDEMAIKQKIKESGLKIIEINDLNDKVNSDNDHIIYSKDEKLLRSVYNHYSSQIEKTYQLTNQYSVIIDAIKKRGFDSLDKINLKPMTPIKVMLFLKAKNVEHAFENVGTPAAFEYKYDGFRVQVHKDGDDIKLFTRQLEDVTNAFPDVVSVCKDHIKAKTIILDAEIVGIDKEHPDKILPFQEISKRIKRKHDIKTVAKEIPVSLNVFDIMFVDGVSLLEKSFTDRREELEKAIKETKVIRKSKILISENVEEVEKFYQDALDSGNEGLMAKNLEGNYKPGNRVGFGMKIKPIMEPLDLVITGATWGEGKRANWLTSFNLSCKDGDDFLEIGKVGTGFKELDEEGVSFNKMTELLKPHIHEESGKIVKINPAIVIEVTFEEIQKSENYNSGYALRFPRFSKLRPDRSADDISKLKQIKEFYSDQHY